MAATKDNRLTAKQRNWCRLVVQGESDTSAYVQAYGASQKAAERNAHRLREHEGVMKELKRLQEKADDEAIMTRRERRRWLSDVIRTPLEGLDETSNLVVEVTEDTLRGSESVEDGLVRKKIKKADPLRAMHTLNQMDGEYAPTQSEISGKGGGPIQTENAVKLDEKQEATLNAWITDIQKEIKGNK